MTTPQRIVVWRKKIVVITINTFLRGKQLKQGVNYREHNNDHRLMMYFHQGWFWGGWCSLREYQEQIWKTAVRCLNRHFISHFLLTCLYSRNWFLPPLFFVLSSLSISAFIFQVLEGLSGQAALSGCRDASVESVRLGPLGPRATFTGRSGRITGMKLLQSPAQYRRSVCKSDCLSASVHYMW